MVDLNLWRWVNSPPPQLIYGALIEVPLVRWGDTSCHTCYPHWAWAAQKEAWLLCQHRKRKKKIERAWKTGREIVREKPLRGQKASGRNGRSFTWPPWCFHWCYLEHKHWHGIQRIWKSSHVSHYQLVNLIFLVSWDGLFIHEHPVETQRNLTEPKK